MSTHFLPRWIEVRHFEGEGSAQAHYEARDEYQECFNLSINGRDGYVSGITACPGNGAIRDVKNYLRQHGCQRMTYERHGREVSIPLRDHLSTDCLLPSIAAWGTVHGLRDA